MGEMRNRLAQFSLFGFLESGMNKKRGPGRPPGEPKDLITLDQAVGRIRAFLMNKYKNPTVVESCAYAKGTLYNKIYRGELHKYRKGKFVLVSEREVLQLVS